MDMLLAKKRASDRRDWLQAKGNLADVDRVGTGDSADRMRCRPHAGLHLTRRRHRGTCVPCMTQRD